MEKIVLKTHEDSLQNYGFLSDLAGDTIYGVSKAVVFDYQERGYTINTEFVENKDKEPYIVVITDFCGTIVNSVPYGTLTVTAEKE